MPGKIRRQPVVIPEIKETPYARATRERLVAERSGVTQPEPNSTTAIPPEVDYARQRVKSTQSGNHSWMPRLLQELEMGASVLNACTLANVSRVWVWKLRKSDEEFGKAYNEACDIGTRHLEQEAQRRAYHGVAKPVFYKGEVCGEVQEYSDTLLMFLLKARKPEVYRDGYSEDHVARPTSVNITVVNVDAPPEQSRAEVSDEARAAYLLMSPPPPDALQ